jgi:GT2 family glycosyltransferase
MGEISGGAAAPRVSFVLTTYNRREVVLHSLGRVRACGLADNEFEVLVVDNASSDGTAAAIHERFPTVHVMRQPSNCGPCAKNAALAVAQGEFIVFIDDDSFPERGSIGRMLGHFGTDPLLGAAVFTITLPDGSRECSAYPDVCIGCGTGFRREALLRVGGLPEDFFMGAEEYDLSLRLLDGGWRVRTFGDLHVTHLKSATSRFPRRIVRLDARNNLVLAMRYFPEPWRVHYAMAWLERYRLMAIANGSRAAFWAGAAEGIAQGLAVEHRPMRPGAFEQFAKIEETAVRLEDTMRRLAFRRVLFVDLGKNMPAYQSAAARCGLDIVAIADERLGGRGLSYRGIPILTDLEASRLSFDAAVISNLSPVHAAKRLRKWWELDRRPVIDLFAPPASLSGLLAA